MCSGAHKYQCRPCESSRVHENARRGHKGANNTLTASTTLHSREKVLVNSLLQAKRVLVDCRGLERALEAVRVSVEAMRSSVEAVGVSIEALRCFRGRERLEEVPENVN